MTGWALKKTEGRKKQHFKFWSRHLGFLNGLHFSRLSRRKIFAFFLSLLYLLSFVQSLLFELTATLVSLSLFRCLFFLSHHLTFYLTLSPSFPISLSIGQSHFVSPSISLSPSLSPSSFLLLYFPLSSSLFPLSLSHSRSLEISVIFSRITHCLALRLWVQQLLLFWQLWSNWPSNSHFSSNKF